MRAALALLIGLFVAAPIGHGAPTVLDANQKQSVRLWLFSHPEYREAADGDCDCAQDILDMRKEARPEWPIQYGYHPYLLVGDFRHDGKTDFAIVVVNRNQAKSTEGKLLIFDGPFSGAGKAPAFVGRIGLVRNAGLVLAVTGGVPIYGPLFSEGCMYLPIKRTYRQDCPTGE